VAEVRAHSLWSLHRMIPLSLCSRTAEGSSETKSSFLYNFIIFNQLLFLTSKHHKGTLHSTLNWYMCTSYNSASC
jgi:hypothetical protein